MFDVFGSNVNPVVNYEGVSKNVMDVGFQEEGRWMYTGGEDGTVKIWDLGMRNLACQRMYNAHSPVTSVRLHPNQKDLVIGDQNGEVHVWDLRSDVCKKYETQPEASVQSVAVDPQGEELKFRIHMNLFFISSPLVPYTISMYICHIPTIILRC